MFINIITSWKFIIFILGVTTICVYAHLNRYEYSHLRQGVQMRYDKITKENCIVALGIVNCLSDEPQK